MTTTAAVCKTQPTQTTPSAVVQRRGNLRVASSAETQKAAHEAKAGAQLGRVSDARAPRPVGAAKAIESAPISTKQAVSVKQATNDDLSVLFDDVERAMQRLRDAVESRMKSGDAGATIARIMSELRPANVATKQAGLKAICANLNASSVDAGCEIPVDLEETPVEEDGSLEIEVLLDCGPAAKSVSSSAPPPPTGSLRRNSLPQQACRTTQPSAGVVASRIPESSPVPRPNAPAVASSEADNLVDRREPSGTHPIGTYQARIDAINSGRTRNCPCCGHAGGVAFKYCMTCGFHLG